MTARERVLAAMRRTEPDLVPKYFEFSPAQVEALKPRAGTEDVEGYFRLDVRVVSPAAVRERPDVSRYHRDLPDGAEIDEWGVAWVDAGFYHFRGMIHPLREISSPREIENYPFPDLTADYRFQGYADAIADAHAAGLAVRADCTPLGGTVLWPAYKLRGMEALLADMMLAPEVAGTLLDRVTETVSALGVKLAGFDVDVLWIADDFGTQRGLLCSLELWREWFRPRLARVVAEAKRAKPGLLVAMHSDGAVQDLVPDLIEMGIDILNPVQPECMDPVALKREYGHHLAFWGTIGTQTTMPFGTPEQVRTHVRRMIETVGRGGGLLVAPTHVVEPEVPWENLIALVETVEQLGVYSPVRT